MFSGQKPWNIVSILRILQQDFTIQDNIFTLQGELFRNDWKRIRKTFAAFFPENRMMEISGA